METDESKPPHKMDETKGVDPPSGSEPFSILARKLSIDHWRSMPIWPEPVDGVEEVLSLQTKPRFRWEHQEFMNLPEEVAQVSPETGSEKSGAEKNQSDNQTLEKIEPFRKKQPHLVTRLEQVARLDKLSGWNATILLAREAPERITGTHLDRLEELSLKNLSYDVASGVRAVHRMNVDSQDDSAGKVKTVSPSMRAAAAEAWCFALSHQPEEPADNYLKAGLALQKDTIDDSVRAELIRGIAREIRPRLIPSLNHQILEAESQQQKVSSLTLSALDACICYAIHHPQTVSSDQSLELASVITVEPEQLDPLKIWPENIWDLRWHQDAQVVNRFGLWLALTKHPIAQGFLTGRLNHLEQSVQYHAIRNLGLLQTEAALKALRNVVEKKPGMSRAVALMAIGVQDEKLIYRYRHDEAAVVRQAIAQFAGRHPSAEAVKTLQELVNDDNLEIQQAAVQAVAEWSNEEAFPVLSRAFVSGAVPTRNRARKRLEQRFGLVITAIQDDQNDRQEILKTISQKFHLAPNVNDLFEDPPLRKSKTGTAESPLHERIHELLSQLEQESVTSAAGDRHSREIVELYEKAPRAFDEFLNQQGVKPLERILEQLDSFGIPDAEKMVQLKNGSLLQRRRCARYFAEQAKTQTLAAWELHLIAERLKQEQDLQVCRDLMMTIDGDTTQQARVVAQVGLTHTWPDVRILGCQYVQKQRVRQLAPFLLPLLQERNASVQKAAILACGYCQNPLVIDGFKDGQNGQQTGLRSLLGTVNRETELLVIAGLARLGDEQGINELLKLSYSPDANTRREVVHIIGELQKQELVEHLIRIGWTEPAADVRLAVLDALRKTVPENRQPKMIASDSSKRKLEIWSDWLDEMKDRTKKDSAVGLTQ